MIQKGIFDSGIEDKFEPMMRIIAEDIFKQRKRIGGDWSVDFAVFSRKQRDMLRKILGPDLIFIVLNMTVECQKERLVGRHGKGEESKAAIDFMTKIHALYEPAGDDEENSFNINITNNMSREDVVQKVLEFENMITYPKSQFPWHNGYWFNKKEKCVYSFVTDEKVETRNTITLDYPEIQQGQGNGIWSFGEFGPTPKELAAITGIDNFNMEMKYGKDNKIKFFGVLNENGTQIHMVTNVINHAAHKPFYVLDWYNKEDLEKLKNGRDSAEAPHCPYAIPQPDKLGKLIWVSGPPGAGKSTTAQLIGRNHGYIFYSVDCFMRYVNPFIDLNVENPSMAQSLQNPLKVHKKIKHVLMILFIMHFYNVIGCFSRKG